MVPVQFYAVFAIFAVLELHRTAGIAKTAGTARIAKTAGIAKNSGIGTAGTAGTEIEKAGIVSLSTRKSSKLFNFILIRNDNCHRIPTQAHKSETVTQKPVTQKPYLRNP